MSFAIDLWLHRLDCQRHQRSQGESQNTRLGCTIPCLQLYLSVASIKNFFQYCLLLYKASHPYLDDQCHLAIAKIRMNAWLNLLSCRSLFGIRTSLTEWRAQEVADSQMESWFVMCECDFKTGGTGNCTKLIECNQEEKRYLLLPPHSNASFIASSLSIASPGLNLRPIRWSCACKIDKIGISLA